MKREVVETRGGGCDRRKRISGVHPSTPQGVGAACDCLQAVLPPERRSCRPQPFPPSPPIFFSIQSGFPAAASFILVCSRRNDRYPAVVCVRPDDRRGRGSAAFPRIRLFHARQPLFGIILREQRGSVLRGRRPGLADSRRNRRKFPPAARNKIRRGPAACRSSDIFWAESGMASPVSFNHQLRHHLARSSHNAARDRSDRK